MIRTDEYKGLLKYRDLVCEISHARLPPKVLPYFEKILEQPFI